MRTSVEPDANLSELWNDVFMFHAREESQHAIVDEMRPIRIWSASSRIWAERGSSYLSFSRKPVGDPWPTFSASQTLISTLFATWCTYESTGAGMCS